MGSKLRANAPMANLPSMVVGQNGFHGDNHGSGRIDDTGHRMRPMMHDVVDAIADHREEKKWKHEQHHKPPFKP